LKGLPPHKEKKMKKKTTSVALWLLLSMFAFVACTPPPWFKTAEAVANVGASAAEEVVSVAEPSLAPEAQKVYQDFQTVEQAINGYIAQPTATTLQKVQAVFTVLVNDEDALLTAFNVSNQHTDTVIKAVLGVIDTAINQIASLIPASVTPTLSASVQKRVGKANGKYSAKAFKKAFNAAVKGDKRFKPLKLTFKERF